MRTLRLVTAAACLCAFTAPTPAADGPAGPAGDLARLLVPREMWAQGIQGIARDVQARLEGHPGSKLKYPPDLPARVRSEVEAALPYEDLIGMHAKELSAKYTPAELNDLLAFHRSPTGKRWLAVQPGIFESVAVQTQKRMEQKMPEVMSRLGKLAESPAGAKPGEKKGEAKKK